MWTYTKYNVASPRTIFRFHLKSQLELLWDKFASYKLNSSFCKEINNWPQWCVHSYSAQTFIFCGSWQTQRCRMSTNVAVTGPDIFMKYMNVPDIWFEKWKTNQKDFLKDLTSLVMMMVWRPLPMFPQPGRTPAPDPCVLPHLHSPGSETGDPGHGDSPSMVGCGEKVVLYHIVWLGSPGQCACHQVPNKTDKKQSWGGARDTASPAPSSHFSCHDNQLQRTKKYILHFKLIHVGMGPWGHTYWFVWNKDNNDHLILITVLLVWVIDYCFIIINNRNRLKCVSDVIAHHCCGFI